MASIAWMAVIFALSSIPGSQVPSGGGTLAHFGVYALLGGLLLLAFLNEAETAGRALAYAILASSLYAVTDELHQAFVPGRVPDTFDWGVDTLGAAFGASVTLLALRFVHRNIGRRAE